MELEEVLQGIRNERGVFRAEVMPESLCRSIVEEESTVTAAGGSMGVRNLGLEDFMRRNTHIVAFVRSGFENPSGTSMRMVDEAGNVIGHDISLRDAPKYMGRPEVTFLSDDFVMYNDVQVVGSTSMEMLGLPYRGRDGWIPESAEPVIWFSSTSSSMMIHRHFDQPVEDLATAMIGLNL